MAIAIQKCLKCGRDVTPRDLQSKVTHPRREEFEALGREIGLLSDPDDTVLGATLKLGETLCASCVPDEQLLGVVNEAIDEFLDDPTTCPLLWDWHELNAASMFAEVAS
jgi:hypothetical protein